MTDETREMEVREKQVAPREGTRSGLMFVPEVDIVEREQGYLLSADLPGVDTASVQIGLKDQVLSIDATLDVAPEPGWQLLHEEYRLGGFHRSFTMSDRIDTDRIEARMRDGVLELELPKQERHQPRQIQVTRE